MRRYRREFLKSCCRLGAASVAAHIAHVAPISAIAQSLSNYKALVCVFLFGGNDSNNLIVPIDSRYNAYKSMRGPVALAPATLRPAGSSGYGLHPALANIQRLYGQNQAAAVFNVGHVVPAHHKRDAQQRRLAAESLFAFRPDPAVANLRSERRWHRLGGARQRRGGRAEHGWAFAGHLGQRRQCAVPVGRRDEGAQLLECRLLRADVVWQRCRHDGAPHLDAEGADVRQWSATGQRRQRRPGDSMRSAQEIDAALNGAPALPVAFPASGLGQQLAQVAQIIAVQGALGMNRQIFFASMGGFDNHEDMINKHQQLMATLDAAIGAFVTTLEQRGSLNSVTLFTESEFNRTGNATRTSAPITPGAAITSSSEVRCAAVRPTARSRSTQLGGPGRCGRPRQLDSDDVARISTPRRSAAGSVCRMPSLM